MLMVFFGGIGYLMKKFGLEAVPLVLAFIMGPLLEQNLRQSLLISGGSFTIFFARPISCVTLAIALLLLLSNVLPFMKRKREKMDDILKEE
jgi:putative tricarboxylic transport membrane protein